MTVERPAVEKEFSAEGLVAAIRAAQADSIRCPEFVKQATTAGVMAYSVFLAGKNVTCIGRKAETHVEHFPRSKS
jgi:uncharacterized protein YbcV (DUF1398 family)